MGTACELLFCLSHVDQRMTEWKSYASFTHGTLSHEPSGRACTVPRGGSQGWGVKPATLPFSQFFFFFLLETVLPAEDARLLPLLDLPALCSCVRSLSPVSLKAGLAETYHFWLISTWIVQLVNLRGSNFQQRGGDKYLGLVALASGADAARTGSNLHPLLRHLLQPALKSLLLVTMQN